MQKEPTDQQCRRRRCLNCKQLFLPDLKSRYHQKFCSAGECRKTSKARSQKLWKEKPQNRSYWCGPEHVERVRAWRKANPAFSGRKANRGKAPRKPVASAKIQRGVNFQPLQDDLLPEDPLIVGVISALAGSSLQDDIVVMCKHLIAKGREILDRNRPPKNKSSVQPLRSSPQIRVSP